MKNADLVSCKKGGSNMKSHFWRITFCLTAVFLFIFLLSCTYDPPEGYTQEHHTYDEILAFAKSLDPDAVVSSDYTDTTIDAWNRNFREWDAEINGIECHVSSVGGMVWNSGFLAGEFAKQYYGIDTDYDYYLLQKIVSENQPDWRMEYSDIGSRYNWNGVLSVHMLYDEKKSCLRMNWRLPGRKRLKYLKNTILILSEERHGSP